MWLTPRIVEFDEEGEDLERRGGDGKGERSERLESS